MAISIQCTGCHRQYNVDDKLAGKMVKCKGCGAAISVPQPLEEMPPLPDLTGIDEPPAKNAPRKCPSCGASIPDGGKMCLACGLNTATGQRVAAAPIPLADEAAMAAQKRRRFVRKPANPVLEQVDEISKLVLALAIFAGVIVWIVQIFKSPAGPSAAGFGPVALLGALLAGFVAPLTAIAIKVVVHKINYVPRTDTYARVLLVVLLPLGTSMMFGWPSLQARFGGFVTLAWILTPALLVYYLRAETTEWVASVITAFVGIALGCLVMTFIVSGVTAMTGDLCVDALPSGPWCGLASGHSPVPNDTTQPAVASAPATAAAPATALAVAPTPATNPAVPTPATSVAVPPPSTTQQVAINVTPTTPATQAAVPATASAIPAPPRPISSPLLSNVDAAESGLQGVNDVVVPSATGAYFLVMRHDETTNTIERWHISPLKNEGSVVSPYYANSPSVYSISPRGDVLVTLVLFPRSQLELSYFDGKTAKKILALDQLQATPSLLSFLDGNRFGIRADFTATNRTAVQICNALTGQGVREISMEPVVPEHNTMAISPNGRYLAALGADRQIAIYNTDTGQGIRKVAVSNNLPFKLVGLAFSPDSTQLAVYSVVADVPTVMSFKMPTGEPTGSAVISKKPRGFVSAAAPAAPGAFRRGAAPPPPPTGDAPAAANHDLLWLQSGKYWLVNGNEFIDTATGVRAGTLDLDNVVDQYLVGPSSILFVQANSAATRNLVLAHLNEDQIQAGVGRSK